MGCRTCRSPSWRPATWCTPTPAAPAYRVASKRLEHGSWTVLGADGVARFYAARAAVWRSRTGLGAVEVTS